MIQHLGKLWQQRFKVLNSVLPRNQYDDGQRQLCKVLLKLKMSICSNERVKLRCRERQ